MFPPVLNISDQLFNFDLDFFLLEYYTVNIVLISKGTKM